VSDQGRGAEPVRLESSPWVRFSVPMTLALALGAVAFLLIARHWVDTAWALGVTAVAVVVIAALLAAPEALVIGPDEVRDESGWRRRGFRIPRVDVTEVRWDEDPDIFEPPRLTFVGADGDVVRQVTVEFDPVAVLGALRAHGWPLGELRQGGSP